MSQANLLLLSSFTLTIACVSDAPPDPDAIARGQHSQSPSGEVFQFGEPVTLPGYTMQPHSGEWQYRAGEMVCDGYLTRRTDFDYCEPNVPADWRAFEYDGQIYYLQPLSARSP